MLSEDKVDAEGLRSAMRVLTPTFQKWIGAVLDELAALRAQADAKPVAWVRFTSDGGYEGPIMDCDRRIDDVRRKSGAWTPLFTRAPEAAQAKVLPEGPEPPLTPDEFMFGAATVVEPSNMEGPEHLCPQPALGLEFDARGVLVPQSAPAIPEAWQPLMKFYQAETVEALVAAMEGHIEKLQVRRNGESAFTRVREG